MEEFNQRLIRVKTFIPHNIRALSPGDFYFAYKQGLLADFIEENFKGFSKPSENTDVMEARSFNSKAERDAFIRESKLPLGKLAAVVGLSKVRVSRIKRG